MKLRAHAKALIITMLIILSASLLCLVSFSADNSTDPDKTIYPSIIGVDYMLLNNPTLVSVAEDVIVVYDEPYIREYDSDGAQQSSFDTTEYGSIDELVTASGKFYFRVNSTIIMVSDGDFEVVATDAFSLFGGGDYIYYLSDSNIVYKLNDANKVDENIDKSYLRNSYLSAADGVIYAYDLTKYNIRAVKKIGDSSAEVIIEENVGELANFFVIDKHALKVSKDNRKLSYQGKNLSFENDIKIAVLQSNIAVSNSVKQSVTYYDMEFKETREFSSRSGKLGKYNDPSHIAALDNSVFIADKGNSRVVRYVLPTGDADKGKYTQFNIPNVQLIAPFEDGLWAFDGSNLIHYDDQNHASTIANADSGVVDMATWGSTLYTLDSSGKVMSYTPKSDIQEVFTLQNASKIAINHKSGILYAINGEKLKRVNLSNESDVGNVEYAHSLGNVIDFSVDYEGNIFAFGRDKVMRCVRNGDSNSISVVQEYPTAFATGDYSVAQNADGDVFVSDRGVNSLAIIKGSLIGAYKNNYHPPTTDKWDVIKVAKLSEKSMLRIAPDNSETVFSVADGTMFLCLSAVLLEDGRAYYYGVSAHNGQDYYISKDEIGEFMPKYEFDDNYPRYNALLAVGVSVYQFPYDGAAVVKQLGFNTQFKLLDNVAGSESENTWGWYRVSYIDEGVEVTGYVYCRDVAESSVLTPQAKQLYYRVKADEVGVRVNVYQEPSDKSDILFELEDGASVIVSSDDVVKDAEFTRVYVNGKYGYVKTANLQPDGMTSVEITAIIVGSICGVALLITIPLFIALCKKHSKGKTVKRDELPQ